GKRVQHGPDGGGRGRVPPGLRRGARRGGRGSRREPRRPLPGGPSAPRRRQLAEALARVSAGRRLDPPGHQTGEDGALHPDGAEVLMATPAEILNTSEERRV